MMPKGADGLGDLDGEAEKPKEDAKEDDLD